MNAGDARSIAERWVAEEASRTPGEVLGAFTWGSINWMAAVEPFPVSSDVDVVVVVPSVNPERHRVRKRAYAGIVVEPFYLPRERFLSLERLLADCAVAPNLVDGTVLLDPEGLLRSVRAAITPELARRHWVRLRCRDRRDQALSLIAAFEVSDSLAHVNAVISNAVMAMAQMALIADLRNPTVKKALVKAHDVLASYGLAEEHSAAAPARGRGPAGRGRPGGVLPLPGRPGGGVSLSPDGFPAGQPRQRPLARCAGPGRPCVREGGQGARDLPVGG